MRSGLLRTLVVAAAVLANPPAATALDNGLALRPPLGWRSYNAFGGDVSQPLMEQMMEALVATDRQAWSWKVRARAPSQLTAAAVALCSKRGPGWCRGARVRRVARLTCCGAGCIQCQRSYSRVDSWALLPSQASSDPTKRCLVSRRRALPVRGVQTGRTKQMSLADLGCEPPMPALSFCQGCVGYALSTAQSTAATSVSDSAPDRQPVFGCRQQGGTGRWLGGLWTWSQRLPSHRRRSAYRKRQIPR